jgi:hypothetical protein
MKAGEIGGKTHFSSYAMLAAVGAKIQNIGFLEPIRKTVHIQQKHVKHHPFEKLKDALIAILAGAHGLVEINTRLRSDKGLQKAFGRAGCAEQSVVQATLNACTGKNVEQMSIAVKEIFQTHSRAFKHDYNRSILVVDIDMTGLPCGSKAEDSPKGYQAMRGIRHGRQLSRALAAQYEEVITDLLYPGNFNMKHTLEETIISVEHILEISKEQRSRIVIRVDSGGGSQEKINWMLSRGYQILTKENFRKAEFYSHGVKNWIADNKHPGRELGLLTVDIEDFPCSVRRIVIRWPEDKTGKMKHHCLITTLEPQDVVDLLNLPPNTINDEKKLVLAYAHLYDLRSGAIEIEIKESKQGIGINKRSKKRFEAQKMVTLLNSLAHNSTFIFRLTNN